MKRRDFFQASLGLAAMSLFVSCKNNSNLQQNIDYSESGKTNINEDMNKPIDYFEPKIVEPNEDEYDRAYPNFINAYICASISALCYKESVNAPHTDRDYKDKVISKLKEWGWTDEDAQKTIVINSREINTESGESIPGTQGLILFNKETVFIAFRGSEKKFNDWFTNFQIKKIKSPYIKGKVHQGFARAFDAIVPKGMEEEKEFKKILNDIRGKKIWLTGHSLGGAIASVAASYLISKKINIEGIYTFGAPRLGDANYRDILNKSLTYKYWRFINGSDIVSDIPLPFSTLGISFKFLPFGFSREGFMIRLTKKEPEILRTVYSNGKRKIWKKYNGFSGSDHSMGNYREQLLKLASNKNNVEVKSIEMSMDKELSISPKEAVEIKSTTLK